MDLALATRAARLGGFADPIPVTLRYPNLTTEREVEAQERAAAARRPLLESSIATQPAGSARSSSAALT